MFDREIVMDSLRKIRMAIETILERSAVVSDPNELLTSPGGMMRHAGQIRKVPWSQQLYCCSWQKG